MPKDDFSDYDSKEFDEEGDDEEELHKNDFIGEQNTNH